MCCTLFLVAGVKDFVFSEWVDDNGNNGAVDGDGQCVNLGKMLMITEGTL